MLLQRAGFFVGFLMIVTPQSMHFAAPHGHDAFLLTDARYHAEMRAYFDLIAKEMGA